MKTKSNVYYFVANNKFDILKEIKQDTNNFVCYGTGNKAYNTAIRTVKPNETVYQIKITVDKIEILYSY